MTTTYVLKGRITEDHRLEVDLPADAPTGDAEVTLVVEATDTVAPRGSAAAMLDALETIHRMHPERRRRTADEIDADLNEMRDEWDSH